MTTENIKSVATSDNVEELLGILIAEPYAVSNGLTELNLEEIGLILEEPIDETSHLTESHDSCKSTFCLLLIELELSGHLKIPDELLEQPLKKLMETIQNSTSENIKIGELKASQIIEERNINLEQEEQTKFNFALEIASSQQTTKETNLESDFSEIANWFIAQKGPAQWSISEEASHRSAIHFLLSACDISLLQRIKFGVGEMWPNLSQSIQALLKPNEFKFNEDTLAKIATDERLNSEILFDGKFPKTAALHCLKYFALLNSVDSLRLSTFELGVMIYFWGTHLPLGSEQNQEGTSSKLSQDQAIHIAFRLFKLDRIKANSENFNQPFSEAHFQGAITDIETIKNIMDEVTSGSFLRKVA